MDVDVSSGKRPAKAGMMEVSFAVNPRIESRGVSSKTLFPRWDLCRSQD